MHVQNVNSWSLMAVSKTEFFSLVVLDLRVNTFYIVHRYYPYLSNAVSNMVVTCSTLQLHGQTQIPLPLVS